MVCTGNICRSPAAERLAQALWGPPEEIRVTSSGVRAMVGERINLSMGHLLLLEQMDTDNFEARQISERHVLDADLILGMTSRHRGSVVGLAPAATRRTYTLLEFARLADAAGPDLNAMTPAGRLRELLSAASTYRAPVASGADDIADPYGEGTEAYEEAYAAIREAVVTVARVLRPQSWRPA